jgi:hypothetical protein
MRNSNNSEVPPKPLVRDTFSAMTGYNVRDPSDPNFGQYLYTTNLTLSRFIYSLKSRIELFFNYKSVAAYGLENTNVWITAPDIDSTKRGVRTIMDGNIDPNTGKPLQLFNVAEESAVGIIVRYTYHSLEHRVNLAYTMRVTCSIQFVFPQHPHSVINDTNRQMLKFSDVVKNNFCDGMYLALACVPIKYIVHNVSSSNQYQNYTQDDKDSLSDTTKPTSPDIKPSLPPVWVGDDDFAAITEEERVLYVSPDIMETVDPSIPLMQVSYTIPIRLQFIEDVIQSYEFHLDASYLRQKNIGLYT